MVSTENISEWQLLSGIVLWNKFEESWKQHRELDTENKIKIMGLEI